MLEMRDELSGRKRVNTDIVPIPESDRPDR